MVIELVKLTLDDAKDIAKHANNKNVVEHLALLPFPYTKQDAEDFINICIKDYENEDSRSENLGIKYKNEIVGVVGCVKKTNVASHIAEVGYWLGEEYWKKGIMTKTLKMIINKIFSDDETQIITADVFSPNIGSQKILEKAGFELYGTLKDGYKKNGKTYDQLNFKLSKDKCILQQKTV